MPSSCCCAALQALLLSMCTFFPLACSCVLLPGWRGLLRSAAGALLLPLLLLPPPPPLPQHTHLAHRSCHTHCRSVASPHKGDTPLSPLREEDGKEK